MDMRAEGSVELDSLAGKQYRLVPLLLALTFLIGGFLGSLAWFQSVDFYHNRFFDHGNGVLIYNLLRGVIALYVTWIVYFTGQSLIRLVTPRLYQQSFSQTDNLVLGFGTGLGVWHLLMLGLGYFNLYYTTIIAELCCLVLCFSATQFNSMINNTRSNLIQLGKSASTITKVTVAVTALALLLLFVVRGIYPNGGGDYYTHYFYYYTNVLKNHGLAPNDVWYHYYYSKGAGLHFLGMLLMDPEAPPVMTYICVVVGAIALLNLLQKLSPRTLWPLFCVIMFVLYNLVSLSHGGGGEFQKTHEETTAMVLIGVWALCLFEIDSVKWEKPVLLLLTSLLIGSAILTQAITVYFACFFALQVAINACKRHWRKVAFYFVLGAIATVSVLGILLMNYLVTGLASDQAFDTMWKFANIEKLHQWGVLPNIMMIAWIRDNYDLVAVPWTFHTVMNQLINFMRLDVLKPYLIVTVIASVYLVVSMIIANRRANSTPEKNTEPTDALIILNTVFKCLGLFLLVCVSISIVAGHSQSVSYFRFSSFFFPLVVVFFTLIWLYVENNWSTKSTRMMLPLFLILLISNHWHNWGVVEVTQNAVSFFTGKYSLANAYAHERDGLKFGGINPGVYEASLQVPDGSRIWSTNVDSYCMAPDCEIESTISFMMSPHLNEILNGKPAEAKRILHNENLDYFIVSKDSMLLDLLPFSKLFSLQEISNYLAIKWTDGDVYLLTWKGPNTKALTPKFMHMYKGLLAKSDHPWFRFPAAVSAMNKTMIAIHALPHPWQPIEFPWRPELLKRRALMIQAMEKRAKLAAEKHELAVKLAAAMVQTSGIKIHHAAYGRNCGMKSFSNSFRLVSGNNATNIIKKICQKKHSCQFVVSDTIFGDPAKGCEKDLKVSYRCLPDNKIMTLHVPSTDSGKKISIKC